MVGVRGDRLTIRINQSLTQFLAGLELPVLPNELKRKQVLAGHPFLRVLLQDLLDELFELPRGGLVLRELHLVSDLS